MQRSEPLTARSARRRSLEKEWLRFAVRWRTIHCSSDRGRAQARSVGRQHPLRQQSRYTADVVVSKREENCCYYVLQSLGSAEIIDMQRYHTPEDAEAAAYAALKSWNGEELVRQLAS